MPQQVESVRSEALYVDVPRCGHRQDLLGNHFNFSCRSISMNGCYPASSDWLFCASSIRAGDAGGGD